MWLNSAASLSKLLGIFDIIVWVKEYKYFLEVKWSEMNHIFFPSIIEMYTSVYIHYFSYIVYTWLLHTVTVFNSVIKFWQKTYGNGLSITVSWGQGLGRFARLTWRPETRALVEKIKHLYRSPLPYDFCRCAVDCVFKIVISKL